jgi:hypothetical protein
MTEDICAQTGASAAVRVMQWVRRMPPLSSWPRSSGPRRVRELIERRAVEAGTRARPRTGTVTLGRMRGVAR